MTSQFPRFLLLPILLSAAGCSTTSAPDRLLDWVRVGAGGRGFCLQSSGQPFIPWGFNYDHDERGRLIEDYWESEWPKIQEDFREMRQLGANVVRIHLQFGKFMKNADVSEPRALRQLGRLIELAEQEQLRLDITGLGCYHKKDVPAWYETLDEPQRWKAQARFWEAVARQCAGRPGVFCYDLMNEPVVPGNGDRREDWLGPPFAGKHFVQFITLNIAGRPPAVVARQWIDQLVAAIRRHDRRTLVTVGLVSWSLDRPGLRSGFVPEAIAPSVDFIAMHLYPEPGKLNNDLETLRGFAAGKPVLIEETFPLHTNIPEFSRFLDASRPHCAGWLGFYWGRTPEECRTSRDIADALMLGWLELFQRREQEMKNAKP